MSYAEGTSVSVERSKIELDTLLRKHGASQRAFADDDEAGRAVVCFTFTGSPDERRQYRLEIPLPKIDAFARKPITRGGRVMRHEPCKPEEQRKRHEQACRERWRAICLLVKAKLELVALGVSSIEREFLADLVLADGSTVHRAIAERIEASYRTGGGLLLGEGDRHG